MGNSHHTIATAKAMWSIEQVMVQGFYDLVPWQATSMPHLTQELMASSGSCWVMTPNPLPPRIYIKARILKTLITKLYSTKVKPTIHQHLIWTFSTKQPEDWSIINGLPRQSIPYKVSKGAGNTQQTAQNNTAVLWPPASLSTFTKDPT